MVETARANGAHATRLESLLHLCTVVRLCVAIAEGSSAQIRENAAERLGEVALEAPEYCYIIVQHVRKLVVDSEWEIRVAASKCVEMIARSLRKEPKLLAQGFATASFGGRKAAGPVLNFQTVEIRKVVQEGAPLLRSGGEEYQYETNLNEDQRKLHAIRQRRLLLQRICGTSDPIWTTREDSLAKQMLPKLNMDHVKDIADDIEKGEERAPSMETAPQESLKRTRAGDLLPTTRSQRRKLPQATTSAMAAANTSSVAAAAQPKSESEDDAYPPIMTHLHIVANLLTDLFECIFDAKWEVRHGALLSLRQILLASQFIESLNASGVSISHERNGGGVDYIETWLEECLVRCICVLALDQFVDYSADGSVSPVREICAQVFGILLGSLRSEKLLVAYLQILRTLFTGSTWHACHGGLLGLKYLAQAHRSHASTLVPLFFNDVVDAFEHRQEEEEVMVLASDMLGEFAMYLERIPHSQLQKTAELLWKALAEHANAGLVPASTVCALSAWYNHQPLLSTLEQNQGFAEWTWLSLHHIVPMMHQSTRTVRLSALICAGAMFQSEPSLDSRAAIAFVRYLLPHLLLQLLQDQDESVRSHLLQAWKMVVACCSKHGALVSAISAERLDTWVNLLWSVEGMKHLDADYDDPSSEKTDRKLKQAAFLMTRSMEEGNSAARVAYADAIGYLGFQLPLTSPFVGAMTQKLLVSVQSLSGERQCGALLAIARWAFYENNESNDTKEREGTARLQNLVDALGPVLESMSKQDWMARFSQVPGTRSPVLYSEQAGLLKRIRIMEARIVDIFAASGIVCESTPQVASSSSAVDMSRAIAEHVASFPYNKLSNQPMQFELAHFKRQDLFLVDESIQQSFARFYHRVQGLGTCAFCNLLPIPEKKSGFLVKALMDSIKQEENADFQRLSTQTIARFVVSQAHVQRKCVAKILSNLCNSAVALVSSGPSSQEDPVRDPALSELLRKTAIRVGGADNALRAICEAAGEDLFVTCPVLEDIIVKTWTSSPLDEVVMQQSTRLICTLVPSIHMKAYAKCFDWLQRLAILALQSFQVRKTQEAVANAITSICVHAKTHQEAAMLVLFQHCFTVFSGGSSQATKDELFGAMLVLNRIVGGLKADVTPYIPSLVHFSMKSMSTQDADVRSLAARAFADLVPLIPLQMDLQVSSSGIEQENGVESGSLQDIVGQNQVSREFLENLLEGKAVKHVAVDTLLSGGVALRSYQQHGVDWLSFLVENNLHGILADDMGLGKTLQTLATIAASSQQKREGKEQSSAAICLVVCPPVVAHHWITEAENRLPDTFSHIIDYSVSSVERKSLREEIKPSRVIYQSTLVITTYSILRTDIGFLKQFEYSFVVLDEAHLIRNPTTSLFAAVQQLRALHRLALSGTPLQNNVADLWSLFEFLMPGYLGEFTLFRKEYVLPISKSRERNATPKQKETAALAITRLHQKVLPFILRRTKSEVLKELPPKIITNEVVAMTPLQKKLYTLVTTPSSALEESVPRNNEKKPLASVVSNLHLLRKICVHPALAANDDSISRKLTAKEKKSLLEWNSSGKMVGLHDLLVESCNLGRQSDDVEGGESDDDFHVAQHRCLVFGHLKETLDLIEQMLKKMLPRVSYRRLDGRTPQNRRAEIVEQFNDDPSIDILLLTTAVGGLGLTLTGADTVIFMEHSWNPFVDMQAMDRAHRIGQKRTVRVFRLITKESLEEHIMDLQAFKERVATTVVAESDPQVSMNANTKEVLNLLQSSSSIAKMQEQANAASRDAKKKSKDCAGSMLPQGVQELLGQLGDLWDESQYDSLSFPDMQGANELPRSS
ncbi:Transcriptional accessory protein, partial [Globisporangium splendens]